MDKTPYEMEIEREIDHDAGGMHVKPRKRKSGGTARGQMARHRHDKASRQSGGAARKWVPGLGDESTNAINKSRGSPIPENQLKSGGRLTAHERQSMPKGDFALPGKGSGPKGAGAGSYPIPDASHARNALARVSQHGSPSEKSRVRAAVHAKYPDIEMSK